jgi:PhnB protein
MEKTFKPDGYNSVSPYFIVKGAQGFMDWLKKVFDAREKRRYDGEGGKIMHAEVQVDDSIIMMADASDKWPPVPTVMHVYVPNVEEVFKRAVDAGCEVVHEPKTQEGDPDKRATFKDFWGNLWSVGTQL